MLQAAARDTGNFRDKVDENDRFETVKIKPLTFLVSTTGSVILDAVLPCRSRHLCCNER